MLIGAHVGMSNGYVTAVDYAVSVGCECMQVFAKSPRQWRARPMDAVAASAFRDRCRQVGMGSVLVHTSYLINLGSADDGLWERSYTALGEELVRAAMLGAAFVVTHVGTARQDDPARTPERIALGVERAWTLAGVRGPRLLLENTAGAGTTFGSGPEELGAILRQLETAAAHTGVCLDTCHAHAAGWDLSQPETWTELVKAFDRCCAMPIEAIHANDCLFGPGSRRDRHAWIGDGTIGYDGFSAMCAEARFAGVPVVTEMPGETPMKDAENITRLKRLRDAYGVCAASA